MTRPPAHVQRLIEEALATEQAPTSLNERNRRQINLVERIRAQYDVDPVDALVWVAHPYAARFPN